ncbi:MAG: hypothetical protein PHS79_03940 [Patescibacteria group bacterium]|nr:hypothetical protein [Patescibacteria group bacterium]
MFSRAITHVADDDNLRRLRHLVDADFVTTKQVNRIATSAFRIEEFEQRPDDPPSKAPIKEVMLGRLEELLFTLEYLHGYAVVRKDEVGVRDALNRMLNGQPDVAGRVLDELVAHRLLAAEMRNYHLLPLLRPGPDGELRAGEGPIPVEITSKQPEIIALLDGLMSVLSDHCPIATGWLLNVELKVIRVKKTPDKATIKLNVEDFKKLVSGVVIPSRIPVAPDALAGKCGTGEIEAELVCTRVPMELSGSVGMRDDAFGVGLHAEMRDLKFTGGTQVAVTFSDEMRADLVRRLVTETLHRKRNLPDGQRLVVLKNPYVANPYMQQVLLESGRAYVEGHPQTSLFYFAHTPATHGLNCLLQEVATGSDFPATALERRKIDDPTSEQARPPRPPSTPR